jgi:hypothetical protein
MPKWNSSNFAILGCEYYSKPKTGDFANYDTLSFARYEYNRILNDNLYNDKDIYIYARKDVIILSVVHKARCKLLGNLHSRIQNCWYYHKLPNVIIIIILDYLLFTWHDYF